MPRAAERTDWLSLAPGNFLGFQRTYDTSELILPRYDRPSGSGTSTMSRGIDTIDTVFPTGSSEATIIVSVRAVLRPTPESTPISSTLIRGISGVGEADGSSEALAEGPVDGSSDGVTSKSGSFGSTGGGVASGTHAPPSATGWKISVAASRASEVTLPSATWGAYHDGDCDHDGDDVDRGRADRRHDADSTQREQVPQQERALGNEQQAQDPRVDEARRERGDATGQRGDHHDGDRDQHRCGEEQRPCPAAGHEVAEAGEDRVEQEQRRGGRGAAAARSATAGRASRRGGSGRASCGRIG